MDGLGQMSAVVLVLALLGGALWWLKSRGLVQTAGLHRRGGRKLQVVERLPLGPHHALHLVRLSGKAMLIASSPSGCTLLETGQWDDLDRGAEVES